MTRKRIISVFLFLTVCMLVMATFWYMKNTVQLVSKDERRVLVSTEVSKALERYYDEHGRYPVVNTNEDLLRELSAKKYFGNDVRIDVVQYVPLNNGQTYELQ